MILAVLLVALGCQTSPDPLGTMMASRVDTPTGSGSAFAISPTELLTAWHVVDGHGAVSVNGRPPADITRIGDLDAAILTFPDGHGLKVWELRKTPVAPAEDVTISGWGAGMHWWSRGLTTTDPRRLSLDIAPGDSGAPVMDSQRRVIGILVARGYSAEHHAHIVPIREILEERTRQLSSRPSTETQSQQ